MKRDIKENIACSIKDFHLPRYNEITDVGLYLNQTTKYISDYLAPLESISITSSMISNYVKQGLVKNAVKKQYGKEQIAYLIYIAIAKLVLSMDDIRLLIDLQKKAYSNQVAYDYFCTEFENILAFVCGLKDSIDNVGVDDSDEKLMLRNTIITVAHKIYLDKYFHIIREENEKNAEKE